MARPRSERLEISSIEEKGYCSVDVYRKICDEKYIFIDFLKRDKGKKWLYFIIK